jgi:hypothetical protein
MDWRSEVKLFYIYSPETEKKTLQTKIKKTASKPKSLAKKQL